MISSKLRALKSKVMPPASQETAGPPSDHRSSFPRFFDLPRELRDEIYSYICEDVSFYWRYWPGPSYHTAVPTTLKIQYHDGPHLGVLQAQSQFRREYLEAKPAIDPTLTIRMGTSDSTFALKHGTKHICVAKMPSISKMKRVQEVTVLIDCGHPSDPSYRPPDANIWMGMHQLMEMLRLKCPSISVLKVAIQCHTALEVPHPAYRPLGFNRSDAFYTPPNWLSGMSLVQRCQGYRFDQARLEHASGFGFLPVTAESSKVRIIHGFVRNGLFLYSRAHESDQQPWWTRGDVSKSFSVRPYSVGPYLPLLDKPHEVQKWKERRGYKDAVDWAFY